MSDTGVSEGLGDGIQECMLVQSWLVDQACLVIIDHDVLSQSHNLLQPCTCISSPRGNRKCRLA